MKSDIPILLVEDNQGDAELMDILLEGIPDQHYVVTNVQRLAQALELIKKAHFDLVILDLGLPDSDGLDTLRPLVTVAADLPIVVLTGLQDESLGLEAVKAGAQDFLNKGQISSQMLARVLRYAFERKQAEISRRNSELKFQTILDALDIQVLLMDTENRIQWSNRKVRDVFSQSQEQIIGKFCFELWQNQDGFCAKCPVEKVKATNTPQVTFRHPRIDKFWDIKACPIVNAQGEITGIVELMTDVSERVQLEEQFYQAQKMEAIGRLAGGVAHDFNNMLSVILGYAEMARLAATEGSQIAEYTDEILEAGKRSADLVRQLLAFSRKDHISPQIINCNTHIDNSQKMLKRLVGEDIEIRFCPAIDLWHVKLDPTQLDQIIVNLVVNSRDAILGVGLVTFATANVILDKEYCRMHVYLSPGEYVLLTVSDTGRGMTKDVLAKMFEPFFTTKKNGRGTGLGMSTIFGIVKQNGGNIEANSEVDYGTTIKIYFPRSLEEPKDQEIIVKSSPRVGHETILVVDDDPAILRICRSMLAQCGYQVLTSSDPVQAIEQAKTHPGKIHLLITDTIMPHMNGKELKEAIDEFFPKIATLFMSGYTSDVISSQGILVEGINFLQKPFTRDRLNRKVREVLEQ